MYKRIFRNRSFILCTSREKHTEINTTILIIANLWPLSLVDIIQYPCPPLYLKSTPRNPFLLTLVAIPNEAPQSCSNY